ncbi:MAG: acyl-CoA thioesterase [Mycobacteriaceae bacterium]
MTSAPGARPCVDLGTRVEWMDTDAAGIYHNSSVMRFVESAEAELMRQRGLDGYFQVAPRVRFEVDFAAPLFFGQEVTVALCVTHIGRSSLTFGFEVWGEAHEGAPRRLAASGSYVTVHVEGTHGDAARSVPWPADWVQKLTGHSSGP